MSGADHVALASSPAPTRGSGTSARCRSGPTRCASSPASSSCLWLGERRWQARGGPPGTVYDVAVWAIPFGLVGARLYHVVSTPDAYFGQDGSLVKALYVWQGGLGIWGAVALGALGAWIGVPPGGGRGCRRSPTRVAPGIVLAQAIGRWGNWFNQELFGKPTDLPWALEIDPANRPTGYEQFSTFHPTFLYESLWNLGGGRAW